MNIVFFGTSEFAIPVLEKLLNSPHKILALVTQPGRKKGRSLKLLDPSIKETAVKHEIKVFQPENAEDIASDLKDLNADLFVVVSFGQILGKAILAIPKKCCVNIHPSLLPKYRGAAPMNWAVINGDSSTGISIIRMNERMDAGDIILQNEVELRDDDTSLTLSDRLSKIGANSLLEAMGLLENNSAKFIKQDDGRVSVAPKLKKRDGLIDWLNSAKVIHCMVKGTQPWPGAYTYLNGKSVKIYKTHMVDAGFSKDARPGEILDTFSGKGLLVKAGDAALSIKELQIEGGKRMPVEEFLRGHTVRAGEKFGNI